MRFSTLFTATFVSFAAAAAITDLPACALSCLATANYGTCSQATLDQACLCQSQEFITSSTTCIRQSCSAEDDATAAQISNELCQEAGVTVSFTATATASAEQTASASAATSAAASAAASAATSAASQVSASASAATSAVASVISSASVAAASATTSANAAAPTNAVGRGAMVAGMVAVAALAL